MATREEAVVKDAERRIQRILIELEEKLQREVEDVQIDARNFAGLRTEIFLRS